MGRFLVILIFFSSAVKAVEYDFLDFSGASAPDLQLDEQNTAKMNALGNYAWGVFLTLENRPLEESHGKYMARALAELPENAELLRYLVAPYLRRSDFAGLVKVLQPVTDQHPDVPSLQIFLGLMYHSAKMRPEAIRTFEHLFYDLKQHSPLVVRELSGLYWAAERENDVPVFLRRAAKTKELRNHFVIDFAQALYYANASEKSKAEGNEKSVKKLNRMAVKHAKKAAELFKAEHSLKSCYAILDILLANKEYAAASKLLSNAEVFFPKRQIPLLIQQADCLAKAGKNDQALALLEQIDMDYIFDAGTLVQIGQIAFEAQDVRGALEAYKRALPLAPESSSIRMTYALLLQHFGTPEKCLEVLEGIPSLSADGYLRKAWACAALKRWEEAEKAWNLAEVMALKKGRKDFESAGYYLTGATIYEGMGKTDASIASAQRAVKLDPENPVAANFLGYSLADQNRRLDEAEKLILFAVSQEPENDAFLDSLAWVYFRQKRFPEAAEAMARCLKAAGDFLDPVILDHAGDVFFAVGAKDLARVYWQQALWEEPPNADDIQTKLKRLPPEQAD